MFIVKHFDYLSKEAQFTFEDTGSTRNKSFIGGLISWISIFMSIGFGIGYWIKLFSKETTFFISSTINTEYWNITDSHNLPFLLRLSDSNNIPYSEPEKIYKITLKYWYGGTNDSSKIENIGQNNEDIPIEQCDINKHFGNYKPIFENWTDLHTFYCPILRNSNQSIYGLYGHTSPFGYYHFYWTICSGNNECYDKEILNKTLSNTYWDLRFLNYNINSFNNKKTKETVINSERFMLSNTVYKRIWMFWNTIKYTTDNGLIFKSNTIEYFHRAVSYRYDVDQRDISTGSVPGTFTTLTILSNGEEINYSRSYWKFQEFVVTWGGIIKCIIVFAYLFNYFHSINSYYISWINNFILDSNFKPGSNSDKKGSFMAGSNIVQNSNSNLLQPPSKWNMNNSQTSNLFIKKIPNGNISLTVPVVDISSGIKKKVLGIENKNNAKSDIKINDSSSRAPIKLKLYQIFIPIRFGVKFRKDKHFIYWGIEKINKSFNVWKFLKNMETKYINKATIESRSGNFQFSDWWNYSAINKESVRPKSEIFKNGNLANPRHWNIVKDVDKSNGINNSRKIWSSNDINNMKINEVSLDKVWYLDK